MYYKVLSEECNKGIKPRYLVNQRIDDVELSKIADDFKEYKYEIYDSRKKKDLKYYQFNWYGKEEIYYILKLQKI